MHGLCRYAEAAYLKLITHRTLLIPPYSIVSEDLISEDTKQALEVFLRADFAQNMKLIVQGSGNNIAVNNYRKMSVREFTLAVNGAADPEYLLNLLDCQAAQDYNICPPALQSVECNVLGITAAGLHGLGTR